MVRTCPGCGLLTDRGEADYFLGALLLNLIAAELVPVTLVGVLVIATWPTPPWVLVLWGGIGLAAIAPIIGYPFSKTLWLLADLQFRDPVRSPPRAPTGPDQPGRDP